VRELARQVHEHPDASQRQYSRGTLDRWIRAYREEGLDGLKSDPRSDLGAVRRHPELLDEACRSRSELRPGRRPRSAPFSTPVIASGSPSAPFASICSGVGCSVPRWPASHSLSIVQLWIGKQERSRFLDNGPQGELSSAVHASHCTRGSRSFHATVSTRTQGNALRMTGCAG
jgi:Helix-turn-helix domain